jgi:oxygen-dependent protoporphyrinogen oxidase
MSEEGPRRLTVVGGGIFGLTLAHRVRAARPDWEVTVLEASDRPGGTVTSGSVAGGVFEHGPNGFLTNVLDTWELARELGLEGRLLPSSDASENRFLYLGGRLRQLHRKPLAFLASDVIGFGDKLRLIGEPFRGRGDGSDESVYDFMARRMGPGPAATLADAMVTGIFAGDVRQLSLSATFPLLADMEREHGSLMKGMGTMMKKRRRERAAIPGAPDGRLLSFDKGMQVLTDALASGLGERVVTGAAVQRLSRAGDGYRLELANGTERAADLVAVCVPSFRAAGILGEVAPAAARAADSIPYAGITVVGLAYPAERVARDVDGFGFLAPRGQGLRMLGCIWTAGVFPDHVPPGTVLLRAMVGGARDPEAAELDEAGAIDLARRELEPVLGLSGDPVDTAAVRWPRGIPQYTVGHHDRVAAVEAGLAEAPGLFVGGNAYRGVGVNDCVREATRLAERITGAA